MCYNIHRAKSLFLLIVFGLTFLSAILYATCRKCCHHSVILYLYLPKTINKTKHTINTFFHFECVYFLINDLNQLVSTQLKDEICSKKHF